jgi:hypothetical protein
MPFWLRLEWNFVMDIASRKLLSDHINGLSSRASLLCRGFFYSAYISPKKGRSSRIGMPGKKSVFTVRAKQETDELVFQTPICHNACSLLRSWGQELLLISESESTSGNGLYIKICLSRVQNYPTGSGLRIRLYSRGYDRREVVPCHQRWGTTVPLVAIDRVNLKRKLESNYSRK